jgi:hypothetical protein
MVQKCATCKKHNRVCRVHVRSGKCSECLKRGQRCDVRVTQSEFQRLAEEKKKLQGEIKKAQEAQSEAMRAQEKAFEELRVARAREERLRRQMDLIDSRADEAIAVESRELAEQELEESELLPDVPTVGLALNLSPQTWGAFEDYPLDFWEGPVDVGS